MVKIEINGKPISVSKELEGTTLLDFIRDFAGLKGTKFGCGMGLCGACTIHIDGIAVRSCQVLVEEVGVQSVTTIEGLATANPAGSIHPVQKAWIEESVPQCGYCQPGQIMTAAAFLKRNKDPSNKEIKKAMDGNLCRCGTYERIRKAVERAAREGKINAQN